MKRIVKALVVAVCICAIIIPIKDEYECKLLVNASYGLPALIRQGEVDNLYLGSSMFRQGIDIFEANKHGGINYILSYNGNQPVMEEWILKYLISNKVTIGKLYVDMYVYTAYSEPQISDEKIFMEVGVNEKWQLYQLIPDAGIEKLLRVFVTANNETLLTWPIQSYLVNQRFEQGGNITETQGVTKEQIQQLTVPQINKKMNSEQVSAIEEIIQIAKENNIEIVFIETPKYISVAENLEYQEAMEEYEKILQQNAVSYLLAEEVWDEEMKETENFIDLLHLSSTGRQKFSKKIFEFLP